MCNGIAIYHTCAGSSKMFRTRFQFLMFRCAIFPSLSFWIYINFNSPDIIECLGTASEDYNWNNNFRDIVLREAFETWINDSCDRKLSIFGRNTFSRLSIKSCLSARWSRERVLCVHRTINQNCLYYNLRKVSRFARSPNLFPDCSQLVSFRRHYV